MNILALECSSRQGSVALLDEGGVVQSWEFECPRGRGAALFGQLEEALRVAPEIGLVIAGTGPGSYNGLRMAIAAGWGIALARGARFAGVSSLLGYDAPEYFAVGDARAGHLFFAHVQGGRFLRPPELLPPCDVLGAIKQGIPVFATSELAELPGAEVSCPHAALLASRAYDERMPAPIYLKPPHITKPA